MNRTARSLAILGVLVLAAVGGFLLLRPGDDEAAPTAAGTPAPAATTTTSAPEPMPEQTATPTPKVPVITIRGGAPVGGVKDIAVDKGEVIRFKVRSDVPDEVHVHGFDVEKPAAPGAPASFRIDADIEGRFEVESHTTGAALAEITVNP